MPKLIIKEKGKDAEKTEAFEREEILLGRASTNNIVLDNESVSRRHARIFPAGSDFFIKDLGSVAGTILNGMRLPKEEKYILKHNDLITIDNFDIKFLLIDEMLNQSFNDVTDSDILEVKLLKKVLRALDRESIPSIEVLNGTAEGKKAFITDDLEELTIGRDPLCAFPIEEYVISRNHAKIIKKWGGIIIQDLNSKNGVYVNNRKVTEEFLHDGDRIALGTIVLIFRNPKEIDINELGKKMTADKEKADGEALAKESAIDTSSKAATGGTEGGVDDDASYTGKALSEEEQVDLVKKTKKREYPVPHAKKQRVRFSLTELGIIGLGVLVFIFAIIMIIKVILS